MIKKGDTIRTIQYPHEERVFRVDSILWPKSDLPILACTDTSGLHVNLLPSRCYKPTGNYKVDLVQQIKLGSRQALKQYVKVFKQVPKFKL